MGIVGYHALNPRHEDGELDVVILAGRVEELVEAREKIASLEGTKESEYLQRLWPLSRRTVRFGSLDMFFCTRGVASTVHAHLTRAEVLEWHHEFAGVIADDSMSILPAAMWSLEDGRCLVTVDGALRGRFERGERVTGLGIFVCPIGDASVVSHK